MGSVMCTYTFDQHPDDLARVFSNKYLEEVAQDRFETRDNFDPFTVSVRIAINQKWIQEFEKESGGSIRHLGVKIY